MMDIDIRGDRTRDLPIPSLLQDELWNRKAFLPLKETLAANIVIHIYRPGRIFFPVSIVWFFHLSYIFQRIYLKEVEDMQVISRIF